MATRGPARPRLAYADPAGRQIKMPGSLPVIYSFCRRLGIAAIIDDLVPIRDVAAAGDGGIPVHHRAYDGGAAEVSQVTGAMTELKKIAGAKTFLLIGDSKLISYDNVAAITGQECTFLAPASRTYVKAAPDHRDQPRAPDLLPDRTRSPPQPSPANQDRRPVQPAARPADRPAHPHRPGRPAADPGHRDQPSADHQAQPRPGPAAGPAGRGPDPPAMTPDPGHRS
jgi:hypothetical protein